VLLQRGKLDYGTLNTDGKTSTINVQYESVLVDLEKPRNRYYTSEDQKRSYPLDLGFDGVPALQNTNLRWGPNGARTPTNNSPPGSGPTLIDNGAGGWSII
jgi:hypothetical protein